MSYLDIESDGIVNEVARKLETLQIEILKELKQRAINNKDALPENGRDAYIQGFCRAIDTVIDIFNTHSKTEVTDGISKENES